MARRTSAGQPLQLEDEPTNPVAASTINRSPGLNEQQMAGTSSSPQATPAPLGSALSIGQQHHKNQDLAQRMLQPPVPVRSHENLSSEHFRSTSRRQQQAHRKRRRHRSTSGRSVSPRYAEGDYSGGGELVEIEDDVISGRHLERMVCWNKRISEHDAGEEDAKPQANSETKHPTLARPQTISAHCWLIDSSGDEQQGYATHLEHQQMSQRLGKEQKREHITVAMLRQEEAAKLKQQRLAGDCFIQHQQLRPASISSVMGRESYGHLAPRSSSSQPIYATSLPSSSSFQTSSLRLLNKQRSSKQEATRMDYRLQTMSTGRGSRRRPFPVRRRSSSPSLSSADGEEDEVDERGGQRWTGGKRELRGNSACSFSSSIPRCKQQVNEQASTLVRLSALLTHVTNLVKRAPNKRLKVAQSSQSMSTTSQPNHHHPQPLNSVSGSLRSGGLYSLAVSSSSSSSAYATESSHLSAPHKPGFQQIKLANKEPAIHLSQMKLTFTPSIPTPGSSLFYSSTSGTSATTQPSTHGYEYCDQQPAPPPPAETRFAGWSPVAPVELTCPPNLPQQHEHKTGTLESQSTSNSGEEPSTLRGPTNTVASDNELISGHLTASRNRRLYVGPSNKATVPHSAPSISSLTRCLWNPYKTSNNASCSSANTEQDSSEEAAARYKCLPSTTTITLQSPGGSILENVISLAKADKTFRLRLIGSLLVSCLLIALICLLFGVLYNRSFTSSNQYNNLNLLIDDSDYDVSWLWQTSGFNNKQQAYKEAIPRTTISQQVNFNQRTGQQDINNKQLRDTLKARLVMIEQSERLSQLLDTLNHLNSIQMMHNNFIDIARMATILNPPPPPSPLSPGDTSGRPFLSQETDKSPEFHLDPVDQDLVSLILLSNLHWPIVKWKHQNQQTVMGFLSSLSSSSSSSHSLFGGGGGGGGGSANSGTGTQTLRNLLAAIMLTESMPQLATNSANLKQFTRLDELLKSTSYDLLSCSYSIGSGHYRIAPLRERYCLKLLARYRETMQTLRHFDQNKLAKLHEQFDLVSPAGKRSVKSLPGFFLDRLAVLSPETVAASLVASENTYSTTKEAEVSMNIMLNRDTGDTKKYPDQASDAGRWQQGKRNSVLDLAKLLIDGNSFSQFEAEIFEEDARLGDDLVLATHLLHPWSSSQLPHFANPQTYDLFLQPNISTRHFHGIVRIELRLERRTSFIVINSAGLQLSDLCVWLKLPASSPAPTTLHELQIRRVLYNSFLEQVYIEFFDTLEPYSEPAPEQAANNLEEPSFVGELPLKDTTRRQNEFVISLSFNGSSSSSYPTPGLKFLQYGDYFAQPDAEVKTMFFTQFEPNNARRLFPCFDEPKFKARFQLNLVHEHQHQVLFNSAKRERVPYTSDGRLQMSVFEQTAIPLSSYLITLMVCDTHSIKSITTRALLSNLKWPPSLMEETAINQQDAAASAQPLARQIQVQILAQFEQLSQAEFASQLAPQLLLFYQSHLLFPYPLEKLDLVAIPRALTSTMETPSSLLDTAENMGLIWFKNQLLMLDTNLISQNLIEQVALLLSHQVAHQYFGNIVSVRSWTDGWILEALCQYLESIALRYVEPDWRLDEQFTVSTIHETLQIDSYWLQSPITGWPPKQQTNSPDREDSTSTELPSLPASIAEGVEDSLINEKTALDSRQSSAILHMFLFTLLPSLDAQTSLLRQCLSQYQYSTMSSRQFWFQFGKQMLSDDATSRRLDTVKITRLTSSKMSSHDDGNMSIRGESSIEAGIETIGQETNERLKQLFESWLIEPGFPLITASSFRDKIRLSQERFQTAWSNTGLDGNFSYHQTLNDASTVWPIPLLFTTSLEPRSSRFVWMDQEKLEVPLVEHSGSSLDFVELRRSGNPASGWWFKLNTNQSSLLRVNYDERNWEILTDLLSKSHYSNHPIGPLDRANLIDDALTLMRCGRLSVGLAMNLTLYLEVGERDYMPWMSVLKHLDEMQILLNQNPMWHRYVLKMVRPISSVIGWKDDGPHLMRKLRRSLFSVALQYGDEKIVSKAKQEFKGWYKSNRFIVPNLQELSYVAGVRYGDQQEWFYCWQKYQRLVSLEHQLMNSTDPTSDQANGGLHDYNRGARQVTGKQVSVVVGLSEPSEPNSDCEKRQLLTALASTQNTWILEQFLNYTLDPRKIQSIHLKLVMQTLGRNPVARLYLWRFVRLNWHNLFIRFMRETGDEDDELDSRQEGKVDESHSILETLIIESTKHFSTKLDYEEVSSFFAGKRKLIQEQYSRPFRWNPTLDNAVRRSLQFIRANIYWCEFIEPKLTKWLAHNDGVIMS